MQPATRSTLVSTAFLCMLVSAAPAAYGQAATEQAVLDSLRSALKKYEDPVVAIHDGYFSTLGCVTIGRAGAAGEVPYKVGGMGVHFLNVQAIGPVASPDHPQVLIYEPNGDKLRLVAAEWFIPLATGVKERPALLGHPFDGPMMGHHPLMPAQMTHWDLHVWLYKPNPLGMFAPTNPNIKCTGYSYAMVEEPPKLVTP